MGKYKSLLSNTLIFAVAAFSSKLLSFLITPILTRVLPPDQFGEVRNVIYTCNLILPIMYLCVSEAIIRFGLDIGFRKSDVYTTGILTVLAGYVILLLTMPLLMKISFIGPIIEGYEDLMRLYVLASAMRTVTTHFVRAGGLVRIFAFDGMITCVSTFAFIYFFLIKLEMGARGYMLATICADAASALLLLLTLKLYRFIKIKGFRADTAGVMLRYSIPLVPTAVFWWVISLSAQYFITFIWGKEATGLYAAASTIPSVIIIVSGIFIQAWQVSAFTEYGKKEAEKFYSNVFRGYYTLIFLAASAIILLVRPITKILVDTAYYESWKYVPFLVLGVSFSCFVTFLGTIYNAVKKNAMVTATTAVGAVASLALNALMIPRLGPIGAAVATFISYLSVFLIRAVDTRKYIRIHMQPFRLAVSLGLLLLQISVSLKEPKFGVFWQIIIFLSLVFCNLGYLLFVARRFLEALVLRRRPTGR